MNKPSRTQHQAANVQIADKSQSGHATSTGPRSSEYVHVGGRIWVRRVAQGMAALLLAQATLLAVPASAQMTAASTASSGQKPIMDAAQNGVPIVHIAPPSAGGVSRNQFDQFNVNSNGAILNNSAAPVQSQQGGWISGNMQLGPVAARIILNEVVGPNASQLRGTIEVAGQRADIVVANPNGITCNGCGFLNANRATLTTGAPQFNSDGSLRAFDVRAGQLTIGGSGLNATNLEQLDLIARGIVIEGEIWAKNLNVIAGANQVLYGTLQNTAQLGSGAAPQFAVDIKDLGGMYANQVYLVSTEQGLGVNSTGRMAALQGNLVLTANGDLSLGHSYASGDISLITTGNARLNGQTLSDAAIGINAGGTLDNKGQLDAQGKMALTAANVINAGSIAQRGTQGGDIAARGEVSNSGTLFSGGQLKVRGGHISDTDGKLVAAGDLDLKAQDIDLVRTAMSTDANATLAASGNLAASGSQLHAQNDLNVTADGKLAHNGGTWEAGRHVTLNGASVSSQSSTVRAGGQLTINASVADNTDGKLLAVGKVALNAQSATNERGQIISDATTGINIGGPLNNRSGTISASDDLSIHTGSNTIDNSAGTIVAGQGLAITGGTLNNSDGVIAARARDKSLTLSVAGMNNARGMVDAAAGLDIESAAAIDNAGGVLQSGTDAASASASLRINSTSLSNNGGRIVGRGDTTIATGNLDNDKVGNERGVIASSSGNVTITAAQTNNVGGLITAVAATKIQSQALNNTGGELSAGTGLDINTGSQALTSNGGSLLSGGALQVRTGVFASNASAAQAAHIAASSIDIQAASFSNNGSIVSADQNAIIALGAGSLSNQGGTIEAQQTVSIAAGTVENQTGRMTANDTLLLQAESIDTTAGTITGGNAVTIIAGSTLNNTQGRIASNSNVAIAAATLVNNAGTVSAGQVANVTLGTGILDNTQGSLTGGQALTLQSGAIGNASGTIASGTVLTLDTQGGQLNNSAGKIVAGGNLRVDSASLDNSAGTVASIGGKIAIDTHAQQLNNDKGQLQSKGDLTLSSGKTSNRQGLISGQTVGLNAADIDNASGQVLATADLTVVSKALGNDAGLLQATGDLTLDTQGQALINTNSGDTGGILAGGKLAISAGGLDNKAGFVGSNLTQTLTIAGDIDNRAANGHAGRFLSNGSVSISAGNVINNGGAVNALGNIAVNAGLLDNRAGQLATNGDASFQIGSLANGTTGGVGGVIDARNINVAGTALNNDGGTMRSANNGTYNVASLSNSNGVINAKKLLAVTAASLANADGNIVGDAGVTVTTSSQTLGGTIASANDVTLNINGNYENGGALSAQRNLTVNANNINNSGKLIAGDTFTANTGDLTNSGEINAQTTNLNVSGTLTNTATGLIDGSNTNISAGITNNTGRIYGDVLRIKGSSINNSGGGTIAGRDALIIGAQYINNSNGALIYSGGDLNIAGGIDAAGNAVGQAQQLLNASSVIEAKGNVTLSVANLTNRNDGLQTSVVTKVEPVANTTYIQPGNAVQKYEVSTLGWDPNYKDGSGRYVQPSSTYPISQFGALPKQVASVYSCTGGGDGALPASCQTVYTYDPADPIWALFGVTLPDTTGVIKPVLPPQDDNENVYGNCMHWEGQETSVFVPLKTGACGAYWNAQDNYATRLDSAASTLNTRIAAFNTDVLNRAFETWNEYQITSRTVTETVPVSTQPAQILADGDITISGNGTKINDNSKIVAGGMINIGGTSLLNQASEGTKSVTEEGQVRFRRIEHHGGFCDCYEIELHPWDATSGAAQVTSFQLEGFRYAWSAGKQSTTGTPDAVNAVAASNTAGAVTAATGSARNMVAGMINAVLPSNGNVTAIASAPPTILRVDVAASGAQAPAVILSTLPRLTPPGNSLFKLHAEPGASYLVETDPRFTNQRNFLSSDYFLQALNRDPARQLKRYGDGFYEQQLVNDQILALTGRRFLSGYSSTQAEYQALMDAGIAFATQYQISPGVTLSPEQMALMTTDIVLLTEQTVTLADGRTQQVLVPQVYLRRPQGSDLQPNGALIAGSDIHITTDRDLVNSGNITAEKSATLVAGNDLLNQGGRISGQDVFVRANNDLKNISGMIAGVGSTSNVTLSAGRDIVLQTRTLASDLQTANIASSRTSIDRIATVAGGNVRLDAARDLLAQGSTINAVQDLIVTAARDIKATTTQGSYSLDIARGGNVQGRAGYLKEESTTNQVTTFNAGGKLALVANKDVNLTGANLNAGNDLLLQGANVTVEAAKDRRMADVQNVSRDSYSRAMRDDESLVGGNLNAGTNLAVRATGVVNAEAAASGNIAIHGATLASESGQVSLVASNDITIGAASTRHNALNESYNKNNSFMSSVTSTTSDQRQTVQAQGSTVSGNTVIAQAGRNLAVQGSAIAGDGDVTLSAEKVVITAATSTRTEKKSSKVEENGFLSGGGFGISYGTRITTTAMDADGTTQSGQERSLVGSRNGDLNIVAKKAVQVSGSDLSAGHDINIVGQSVTIDPGLDTNNSKTFSKMEQDALTLAVGGSVVNAIQTLEKMDDAASKTKNGRVQALAAATAAAAAANVARDIAQKGINVSISLTAGHSESEQTQTHADSINSGSKLAAGNNLTIVATGAGKDSNLNVIGSNLSAGKDVTLIADNQINLQAAQDTEAQHSKSSSMSVAAGIGASIGTSGIGFGFVGSASLGRGQENGEGITQVNTHVNAGNALTIQSGGDTNLKGAVVGGKQVIADIGGNLNIESLQDTAKFDSKIQNISVEGMAGVGGSFSASFNQSKIKNDYASVQEQSGIVAGDNGFQLKVKGNTDLKGAVIASSQAAIDNNKNSLTTATLTTSEIQNHADYNGSSFGVSGSQTNDSGSMNAPVAMALNGSDGSITRSGISAANIGVTDQAGQKSKTGQDAATTVANLNRDVVTGKDTSGKIANNFNKEEIEAGFAVVSSFTKEVGTYIGSKAGEADALKKAAADPSNGLTPEQRIQLEAQAKDIETNWGPGGTYRQIATALTAAASGNVAGSGSQFVQAGLVNYVQQQGASYIGKLVADDKLEEGSPEHAALHAIVACAGAAASSQNCNAGAVGAAASSLLTNLFKDDPTETSVDKENKRNLVTSLVAGIAATDGAANVATSVNAATAAVDNNWLTPKEIDVKKLAQRLCTGSNGADARACGTLNALNKLDARREASNNGTLYKGISKGLTDLLLSPVTTPVGLVNSIIENGAAETAINAMKGVAGLPKNLYDGLTSNDPEKQGKALVDALALGYGVAQVARSVAKVGAKGTTSSIRTADALLPDADFAGRGVVRPDLTDHLVNPGVSGKQISGGHDLTNFGAALNEAGGIVMSKVEKGPGIYEIQYQLPNATRPATKTVYDPSMYPDMANMASTAANKALVQYQITGVAEQNVIVNGVEFFVPIRVTPGKPPSVPTAYPIKGAK